MLLGWQLLALLLSVSCNSQPTSVPCPQGNCETEQLQQNQANRGKIPEYQEIKPNVATKKVNTLPKELQNIPLFIKTSKNFRAIWYDIRHSHWGSFDKIFSNSIERGVDISIHQPLHNPSILPFDPDNPLGFYLIGHLLKATANKGGQSYVISPSPYTELGLGAIAPPQRYQLVWQKDGKFTQDMAESCMKSYDPNNIFISYLSTLDCESFNAIQTSLNQSVGTINNAYDEIFKKQSVAIWKPIPQDGYKCLGHLATNGDQFTPFTEEEFQDPYKTYNYATYCVREELLSPGKLTAYANFGYLNLFRIEAQDQEGFPMGMFYAATRQVKEPVWVLKRSAIHILNK